MIEVDVTDVTEMKMLLNFAVKSLRAAIENATHVRRIFTFIYTVNVCNLRDLNAWPCFCHKSSRQLQTPDGFSNISL